MIILNHRKTPFDMGKTGCKPVAVKILLYGSYRKVLESQPHFVAKERWKQRSPHMKEVPLKSLVWVHLAVLMIAACCARGAANLAIVAKPSTSYVSGDCSVGALNDASQHRNSRDRRAGSYGNWSHTGMAKVSHRSRRTRRCP